MKTKKSKKTPEIPADQLAAIIERLDIIIQQQQTIINQTSLLRLWEQPSKQPVFPTFPEWPYTKPYYCQQPSGTCCCKHE